jgi:hypothetical protein
LVLYDEDMFSLFTISKSKPQIMDKLLYLAGIEGAAEANIHIVLEQLGVISDGLWHGDR